MARGNTYSTRGEAVAAAQTLIELRLADANRRLAECRLLGRDLAYLQKEVELWGGKP